MNVIDTIGFDDPKNDTDVRIIAELVSKLKNNCDYVNLFGIAVNGQAPRIDGSLVAMIKIFEEMFGRAFWNQCVLLFTRVSMNEYAKKKRERLNKKSDNELATEYVGEVENMFPNGAGGLRYLFLDACYDEELPDEVAHFEESMGELYKMLDGAPKLATSRVNENVQTENARLRKAMDVEIRKHESQIKSIQEDARRKIQRVCEEAEQRRKEDIEYLNKSQSEAARNIQSLKEEIERIKQDRTEKVKEMEQETELEKEGIRRTAELQKEAALQEERTAIDAKIKDIGSAIEAKIEEIELNARSERKRVEDEATKRIKAMEIKLAAAEKAVEEERAAAAEAAARKKGSSIWGKLLKTVKVAFKAPSPDVFDSDYE